MGASALPNVSDLGLYNLTQNDIVRHCKESQCDVFTLHARSSWKCGKLFLRLDVDAFNHSREDEITDADIEEAVGAARWAAGQLGADVHVCESDHGASGYLWLQIFDPSIDGPAPFKLREVNYYVVQVTAKLRALALDHGFRCDVEGLKGSFVEAVHDYDKSGELGGMQLSASAIKSLKGTLTKLPPTLDDVVKVMSLTPMSMFFFIKLALGLGVDKWEDSEIKKCKAKICAKVKKTRGNKLVTPLVPPTPTGNKLTNTLNALIFARRSLGIRTKSDLIIRECEVLELSHKVYVDNLLGDSCRDSKRDKRFDSTFTFMVSTFDDAKAAGCGGGEGHGAGAENFFSDSDIKSVTEKLHGLIPRCRIDQANLELRKIHQSPFDYAELAIAACTMVKNIGISDNGGHIPASAITGMLHYFNSAASGSTTAKILNLLVEYRVLMPVLPAQPNVKQPELGLARSWVSLKPADWFNFLSAGAAEKVASGTDKFIKTMNYMILQSTIYIQSDMVGGSANGAAADDDDNVDDFENDDDGVLFFSASYTDATSPEQSTTFTLNAGELDSCYQNCLKWDEIGEKWQIH